MRNGTIATIILVAIAVGVGYLMLTGGLMSVMGGTEVKVTISADLLEEAEQMDIEYVDLRIYVSTDSGDELVHTERLEMMPSQTFYVSGLEGMGSVSMTAVLPDGDGTDLRQPADTHIESGDVLMVYFYTSTDPYFTVA